MWDGIIILWCGGGVRMEERIRGENKNKKLEDGLEEEIGGRGRIIVGGLAFCLAC